MDKLFTVISKLKTLKENLKKSCHREWTTEYINKKKEDQLKLIREFNSIIVTKDEAYYNCKESVKTLIDKINEILQSKTEQVENKIDNQEEQKDNEDNFSDAEEEPTKTMAAIISFRDIEDALEYYDGESNKDVDEWLTEFGEVADTCQWSDIHKLIYARRQLKGAAKLAVASQKIASWEQLSNFLKTEFNQKPSAASIHRTLGQMRKNKDESLLQFAYRVKQTASKSNMDEESIINYIITGIYDDSTNKNILYDAKTFNELKNKLETYSKIKESSKYKRFQSYQPNTNKAIITQMYPQQPKQSSQFKPHFHNFKTNSTPVRTNPFRTQQYNENVFVSNNNRCTNCGAVSHNFSNCPYKQNGNRCFQCNEFGHIAKNCPKNAQPSTSGNNYFTNNNCNKIEKLDMHINIFCCGIDISALVDTGSDVTLMKKNVYDCLLNAKKINLMGIPLTGFGQTIKKTYGNFSTQIVVNHEAFDINCHVVPNNYINENMLLGKDFLSKVEVNIRDGEVKIIKKISEVTENCENFINKIDVVAMIEEKSNEHIENIKNKQVREEVEKLIVNYTPVKPIKSCVSLKITLEDEIPIYQSPRRLAVCERQSVNKQIDQWLNEGIIQNSRSNYSSPIVLVKKKDNSHRICVDYRKLNKKIIKDRYPLPVVEDVLEKLYDSSVFTTLDLKNGFFHVDVEQNSRKFTSFVTPDGQYEFLKVPFGLCNSPSVFMRYINTIFHELIRNNVCILYMDDVIIPAKSEDENLKKLKLVFEVAIKNGLIINFEKCKFVRKKIEFLGHIVEKGFIKPSLEKTKAIRNFPIPKNVKQVQSFLGLAGFFRKFIFNFSIISKPLSDLIKLNTKFIFGSEQQSAFKCLKEKLCNDPVLKLFNPDLETELHADASKDGFGSCLLQKHDGKFHPVFYVSFKTTDAEAKYTSYELEVLAVIKSLKKLRVYLLGIKFKIFTDCKAFELTMKKQDLYAKIARWALMLEEYNYTIHHRKGTMMRHVDALSRYPSVLIIDSGVMGSIKKNQETDSECQLILEILKYNKNYKNYVVRKDILYRFDDGTYLLVLPKNMQTQVIRNVHEQGHIHAKKCEANIKQDYYISELGKKIQNIITNCVQCILVSRKAGKQECFLNPIDKLDVPLHTLHIDHVGPLPSTAKSYQHLFVVSDAFTKFVWLHPVKNTTCDEVLKRLELQREIFGNPVRIISDKGGAFISKAFEEYCENNEIIHIKTTTGVPRGNGQVERANGILIPILAKLSTENPMHWYKHVAKVQQFMNSTKSRSTNRSPFELLFGVPMRNREDQRLNSIIEQEIITDFEMVRQNIRKMAKDQIGKIQQENVATFNKKRKDARTYDIGDLVAMQRTQFGTGQKLYPKFLGPYKIVKVKRNYRYDLEKIGNFDGPIHTSSSADLLKPWVQFNDGGQSSEADD